MISEGIIKGELLIPNDGEAQNRANKRAVMELALLKLHAVIQDC